MLYKKRLITAALAMSIAVSGSSTLAAFAADEAPAEMGDMGDMGGTPPEMPDGEAPAETGEESSTNTMPFTDVSSDYWYYSYILDAYNTGIISGVSNDSFAPQSSITGADFLTMLFNADSSESQYSTAQEWAEGNSILTDSDTFDLNSAISRENMMVLLYRYFQYKNIEFSTVSDLSDYTDSGEISADALEAVQALVGEGIITGYQSQLRPGDNLSRAEAAVILVRALELTGTTIDVQETMPSEAPADMPGSTPPDMPGGDGGDMQPTFGGSGEVTQGTSANTIDTDGSVSDETYTSTGDDENALRITEATVTLDNITVNKSAGSSSNTEDGDFYGLNAALLATDGATVTITNSDIQSSTQNGNGIFSYGEGTSVTVSDTTITTTADHSGGLQTTGGGYMTASNLTINTSGSSSAAIRTDRGGGTVYVDGGTYTTNGYNSPAVYSTADITVSNSTLTAVNSEALVIEGRNSITLYDCDVSGNMSDTHGTSSDENVHNVMIYQSMSGDAEVGTSTFTMTGGTLLGNNGDLIYVTNTHSIITLSGVTIVNEDDECYLMRISGNTGSRGWGTAGANGAQAEVTADAQTLEGDIVVDSISTLTFSLTNGSDFTGTINIIDNAQGGTAVSDNADVYISEDSTWTLTGDCTLSSLDNNGTINFNGYTITLADGTVLSE